MGKYRIELNSEGVQELLKSPEMEALCRSLAEQIAGRAGGGYEVTTCTGKTRERIRTRGDGRSIPGQPEKQYAAEGGGRMIEATVISYLGTQTGIPTYAERPKQPEAEYLIVERTGSGEENLIQRVTITIQSYADSLLRAAEINKLVETAMKGITTLEDISQCKLNSSYNYTDTESKKYRYQAVFNLVFMEGE